MNAPTAAQPVARFCPTCGFQLPGPVPVCPRCATSLVGPKKRNGAVTIVVIVVAVFLAVPCLGILAAIAIPNFIRYQLRAKASEVPALVEGLVRSEQAALARGGKYVALPGRRRERRARRRPR